MSQPTYIFWTSSDQKEAKRVIYELLNNKLIACASILPNTLSIYRWNGQIEESQEAKVLLKTQQHHFKSIEKIILQSSSYDNPEITEVLIQGGSQDYLSWLIQETS